MTMNEKEGCGHRCQYAKERLCNNALCGLQGCHSPSGTEKGDWRDELPQAILAALEYRGFYDCGKYLDDTFLEHIAPIIQKEIEAAEKGERAYGVMKAESAYDIGFDKGRAEGKSICLKEVKKIIGRIEFDASKAYKPPEDERSRQNKKGWNTALVFFKKELLSKLESLAAPSE